MIEPSPIIINIPGAKLLSSKLSKNERTHRFAKAAETRLHREGANAAVSKALGAVPGYRSMLNGLYPSGEPRFIVRPSFKTALVVLSRLCPRRYFADDGDNAATLLSATRDGVADALGINDKVFKVNPTESDIQSGRIAIRYEQIDGDWGVRIIIEPA